jgi:hypothetical protein
MPTLIEQGIRAVTAYLELYAVHPAHGGSAREGTAAAAEG